MDATNVRLAPAVQPPHFWKRSKTGKSSFSLSDKKNMHYHRSKLVLSPPELDQIISKIKTLAVLLDVLNFIILVNQINS
jgi:hypothetical protein